jgi:2-hydroxychromene-2-carboxylate isomerase
MNGTNEQVSVTNFLSSAELPLPTFDENSDTSPVYHLRRLDEFIQFRGVPKALQLATACRSMVGKMSKQWVEAVSQNLADYESFKEAFLKAWWSSSCQFAEMPILPSQIQSTIGTISVGSLS